MFSKTLQNNKEPEFKFTVCLYFWEMKETLM